MFNFTYSAVQILKLFFFLAFIEIQRQLFHPFFLRLFRLTMLGEEEKK
jgi:hypothetical protein